MDKQSLIDWLQTRINGLDTGFYQDDTTFEVGAEWAYKQVLNYVKEINYE